MAREVNKGKLTHGVVVEIDDPEGDPHNKEKVKVRVPALHGPLKKEDLPPQWQDLWVDDKYLPWLPICYPLGTGSPNKSMLKEKELVFVLYTNEDYSDAVIIGTAAVIVKE